MEKEKNEWVGKLISVVVLLGIIGCIGGILYFNVGNVTDKYMKPLLQNIPVVKNIVPTAEKQENQEDLTQLSKEEIIQKLNQVNEELTAEKEENSSLTKEVESSKKEIQRLQEIETQHLQFLQEKEAFDRQVVYGEQAPTLEEYRQFYEQMNPETAESIYREIVGDAEISQELKKYAATYQEMDASSAAGILEKLTLTDIDLVIQILENIDAEQRADILGEMEPQTAARITKRLAPSS